MKEYPESTASNIPFDLLADCPDSLNLVRLMVRQSLAWGVELNRNDHPDAFINNGLAQLAQEEGVKSEIGEKALELLHSWAAGQKGEQRLRAQIQIANLENFLI